jgi:replicative DNA helicase
VAAEAAVLGAMMVSKDAIGEVVEIVSGSDFYRPAHEQIFEAVIDLYGRGEPADAITVVEELTKRGQLAGVGGHIYIHELLASVSIASNAVYYAEIVHDKAVLRRLVEAATRIAQLGHSQTGDVHNIVDQAQQLVYSVGAERGGEDYSSLAELMEPTLDEIQALCDNGAMAGVPTGFHDLDATTNGLHPGQMVIVAARPGVGKSTLGLDFARSAAIRHNLATGFFSLEMTKSEIVMRLIAAEASVFLGNIRTGNLGDDEWHRIANRMGQISAAPLFIDDSPNLTMMEIRAKARRLKQRNDLKLIVIDYLQLMTSGKRVENRQVEVSEFSRQVKLLAKELDVPVVALSQLNRSAEKRDDKRPQLADLRESGSLEQDADVVILLHRDDMYGDKTETQPGGDFLAKKGGTATFILAKHRNGETGKINVAFQGHYSRFADIPHTPEPPPDY